MDMAGLEDDPDFWNVTLDSESPVREVFGSTGALSAVTWDNFIQIQTKVSFKR
jgi:hypothetical protein